MVGLVAAGLALGGDDGDDSAPATTTSTRRRAGTTSSTAPPVTAPSGPVLPVQTGAALLLVQLRGPWIHLDLDTGARTEVDVEAGDNLGAVGVRGGVVVILGPRVRYVPLPAGEPVELGEAGQVLPTGNPDEVWLMSGPSFGAADADERDTARVVVAATGEPRTAPIRLPGDGYVSGATDRGLVVVAGGRPYLVARDGAITPLPVGDVYATTPTHVVLYTCDDRVRCRTVLHDVATGQSRPIDLPADEARFGLTVLVSPDGELATISYSEEQPHLAIGRIGGPLSPVDLDLFGPTPVWLPAGQGLVYLDGSRAGVTRVVSGADGIEVLPVDALADDRGEGLVVIPP